MGPTSQVGRMRLLLPLLSDLFSSGLGSNLSRIEEVGSGVAFKNEMN